MPGLQNQTWQHLLVASQRWNLYRIRHCLQFQYIPYPTAHLINHFPPSKGAGGDDKFKLTAFPKESCQRWIGDSYLISPAKIKLSVAPSELKFCFTFYFPGLKPRAMMLTAPMELCFWKMPQSNSHHFFHISIWLVVSSRSESARLIILKADFLIPRFHPDLGNNRFAHPQLPPLLNRLFSTLSNVVRP